VYHSCITADMIRLGYDTPSMGKRIPTCRGKVISSSSMLKIS